MNLCGSFRGGGADREVEPDRYLLARVDFRGAMGVDLGLEICKHPKKRERERKGWPNPCGGKVNNRSDL